MAGKKAFRPEVFTKRFQQLSEEAKVNQVLLAQKTGLTQASISRYLSGAHPNLRAICLVAQSFGVSTDWLLGRKDTRK